MVKARDIDRIGINGIIENLKERVGITNVYISVDIDVLDPAFAPGKSNFYYLFDVFCLNRYRASLNGNLCTECC
jgi:hypothetical protein